MTEKEDDFFDKTESQDFPVLTMTTRLKKFIGKSDEKDKFLIVDLLTWMHQKKADYTNTFCYLMNEIIQKKNIYKDDSFLNWKKRWEVRLKSEDKTPDQYLKLMKIFNPLVIPRNHKVEEALKAAEENNLKPITKLIEILKNPYLNQKNIDDYQIPSNSNENYQTFCGT